MPVIGRNRVAVPVTVTTRDVVDPTFTYRHLRMTVLVPLFEPESEGINDAGDGGDGANDGVGHHVPSHISPHC